MRETLRENDRERDREPAGRRFWRQGKGVAVRKSELTETRADSEYNLFFTSTELQSVKQVQLN